MRAARFLALLLLACGDAGTEANARPDAGIDLTEPISCERAGTGEAVGKVAGYSFGPVVTAGRSVVGDFKILSVGDGFHTLGFLRYEWPPAGQYSYSNPGKNVWFEVDGVFMYPTYADLYVDQGYDEFGQLAGACLAGRFRVIFDNQGTISGWFREPQP